MMMDNVIRRIVDKDKPSLMMFDIFGHCIGIGVYNPQTNTPDNYNPENDIMRLMGFDNTDDYRNSYPGLCLSNSASCIVSKWGYVFNDKRSGPPEVARWMMIRYVPIPKHDDNPDGLMKSIYGWSKNRPIKESNVMWITRPKMSQVRQLPEFKRASKKALWFCEDWQE